METPEVLAAAAKQLDGQRRQAKSDDEQQKIGEAWTDTIVAERHARLVDVFLGRADDARNRARWLSSQPRIGDPRRIAARDQLVEDLEDDAGRFRKIAERHRVASEECQAKSDALTQELRKAAGANSRPANARPRREPPPASPPPTGGTTP